MSAVFVELDDIYNRHVAIDVRRIVALHSTGDHGTNVHLDTGHEIHVGHRVGDVLDRMRRAVRAAEEPEP